MPLHFPCKDDTVSRRYRTDHGLYDYVQTNLTYSNGRMASNRLMLTQITEIFETDKVKIGFEPIKVDDLIEATDHILPSEKAFAFKLKLEAIKHQGVASRQVVGKSESADSISDTESGRTVKRYMEATKWR